MSQDVNDTDGGGSAAPPPSGGSSAAAAQPAPSPATSTAQAAQPESLAQPAAQPDPPSDAQPDQQADTVGNASTMAAASATAAAAAATAEAAAVTAGTAAALAAPALQPDPDDATLLERDRLTHPDLALAVLGLFLVASAAKMNLFVIESAIVQQRLSGLASTSLAMVTAFWFIRCFTGDAQRRITDIFVFAYAFTIGSFALLVLPFVSEPPSTVGARPASLELLRACVRSSSMGGLGAVSAVVMCPGDDPKAQKWPSRHNNAGNAGNAGEEEQVYGGEVRYTLMLAIGGVTAVVVDADAPVPKPADTAASAVAATAASAASAASATSPDSATSAAGCGTQSGSAEDCPIRRHSEVMGGLAVPFFVLVMAFIGGAVSLSRRIPEYQRRMHPSYVATDKESKLQAFQAREYVVFQIMQLVSAPFLAVATWFIVSPASLTSAATLAFGTGFASEPLLLMIRGLVEGIRPGSSVTKPAVPDPQPDPQPDPKLEPEPKDQSGDDAANTDGKKAG